MKNRCDAAADCFHLIADDALPPLEALRVLNHSHSQLISSCTCEGGYRHGPSRDRNESEVFSIQMANWADPREKKASDGSSTPRKSEL